MVEQTEQIQTLMDLVWGATDNYFYWPAKSKADCISQNAMEGPELNGPPNQSFTFPAKGSQVQTAFRGGGGNWLIIHVHTTFLAQWACVGKREAKTAPPSPLLTFWSESTHLETVHILAQQLFLSALLPQHGFSISFSWLIGGSFHGQYLGGTGRSNLRLVGRKNSGVAWQNECDYLEAPPATGEYAILFRYMMELPSTFFETLLEAASVDPNQLPESLHM